MKESTPSSKPVDDKESERPDATLNADEGRPRVSAGWIWMLVLAMMGTYMALVGAMSVSLSLRVQEIAPENVEVLGYVIGAGAIVAALSAPLVGMWSDHFKSKMGRRRPFALAGAIIGLCALAFLAWAPSVPLLAVGWMFAQLGWGSVINALLFIQADRLPEDQRGTVSGLSGFAQMFASVLGAGVASAFIGNNYLVFLVPGAIGFLLAILWVIVTKEPSSVDAVFENKLTFAKVLANMVFNPKKHPDFAWNWLARLVFNFGVTFATTFTTLFFASKVSATGQVSEIGPIIAMMSLIGVVFTAGGALGGGMLSDKLKRRRVFVMGSGIVFTIGALIMAFGGGSLPVLIGVSGLDKNYELLFMVASVCTLIGGSIVTFLVKKTN